MAAAVPELVATCWTTAGNASPQGPVASPLDLHDRIAAASAAGFRGFGILGADLEQYLRTSRLAELRTVLRDHGMTTVELEVVQDWWVPEGPRQAASDRYRRFLLTAAEALGARDVKLIPSTIERGFDLDRCAAAFHAVCAEFSGVGSLVALEFLPFGSIATLAEAVVPEDDRLMLSSPSRRPACALRHTAAISGCVSVADGGSRRFIPRETRNPLVQKPANASGPIRADPS